MSPEVGRHVRLGEISGVYGVKGWVKLISFTDPRTNIFDYAPWRLMRDGACRQVEIEASRVLGRKLIAKLVGIDDRDAAAALVGAGIEVPRAALPECAAGEYYWADLQALEVVTEQGEPLGRVESLVATGANDVLVLDREGQRMIPFVLGSIVREVDLERGRIVVAWDPAYWE